MHLALLILSLLAPNAQRFSPWIGSWERQVWGEEATLTITRVTQDSIYFTLVATSGGNTGDLDGAAVFARDKARYVCYECDSCVLDFTFEPTGLFVEQRHGLCGAGMGVTYDGHYVKQTTINVGATKAPSVFKDTATDNAFRKLTGDSGYELFANSTQLIGEAEDLDGFGAQVRTAGVRGLFTFMENIVIYDERKNFWTAVIDDERVLYFTNVKQWKKKLPKTIEKWRSRFTEYPVIYRK